MNDSLLYVDVIAILSVDPIDLQTVVLTAKLKKGTISPITRQGKKVQHEFGETQDHTIQKYSESDEGDYKNLTIAFTCKP